MKIFQISRGAERCGVVTSFRLMVQFSPESSLRTQVLRAVDQMDIHGQALVFSAPELKQIETLAAIAGDSSELFMSGLLRRDGLEVIRIPCDSDGNPVQVPLTKTDKATGWTLVVVKMTTAPS
jgi:hypothetical protein